MHNSHDSHVLAHARHLASLAWNAARLAGATAEPTTGYGWQDDSDWAPGAGPLTQPVAPLDVVAPVVAPLAVWTPPKWARDLDGEWVMRRAGSWDDLDAMRRETMAAAGGMDTQGPLGPRQGPHSGPGAPRSRAGSTLQAAGRQARGVVHVARELRQKKLTRKQRRAAAKRARAELHRTSARMADSQERVY